MENTKKTNLSKGQARGMNLADYKDLEREARGQILIGRKMTLIGELILDDAQATIKLLGGKTYEEEDEEARKEREKIAEEVKNNKDNDRNTIAS